MIDAEDLVGALARRLLPGGIDLVRPLRAGWYDAVVGEEYRLPDVGRGDALAVVLASTRAFWAPFVRHLRTTPGFVEQAHPIEAYVTGVVQDALADLPVRHQVRFSHEPPPRRVAMQRLAHVAGLAALTPSMLCVHPTYGPWIGLRAAVVLDAPGPSGEPPVTPAPCADCAERCEPALVHAQALATTSGDGGDPVAGNWRAWLAVRDACPVGREHRYPDAMIRYVYTKDRGVLRGLLHDGIGPPDSRRSD
jgi:methylmalonic aciduria homocystinuria type C protein